MNILIVTAHPSTQGFTHKIADSYKKGAEEAGHAVEVWDLYRSELNNDYFRFEDVKDLPQDRDREVVQEKIRNTQEVVFIFPIWWMGAPAILKNFMDKNFTAKFAFRYKYFPVLKGIPVGLLTDKQARVFVTCDGSRFIYKFVLTPFKTAWKYFILGIFGFRVRSFIIFDRMRWSGEKKREKRLHKAYELGKSTKI